MATCPEHSAPALQPNPGQPLKTYSTAIVRLKIVCQALLTELERTSADLYQAEVHSREVALLLARFKAEVAPSPQANADIATAAGQLGEFEAVVSRRLAEVRGLCSALRLEVSDL